MFELINVSSVRPITNKQLQTYTNRVIQLTNENVRNDYRIAAIFAQVDETECYKDDGFKNVTEWAVECIGYKKSQCYNYIKVGKEYTREVINAKGKSVGYCSNLLPIPGDEQERETTSFSTEPAPAPERDFSVAQTMEVAKLNDRDKALELIHDGAITPEMSCRDIKQVIDKAKSHDETSASDESTDDVTSTPKEPKAPNLSKYSTTDLINELIKRGYRVSDGNGNIWEADKAEPVMEGGETNAD